jgi:Family of unknown function (DUF5996)
MRDVNVAEEGLNIAMTDAAVTTFRWPELPYAAWRDTLATLHMWTQIVGKIRLVQSPWLNHSWHVTLYVTPRGLSTGPVPHGQRTFGIDFDFIDHALVVSTCEGDVERLPLVPQDTADFYRDLMHTLDRLRLPVTIHARPNEVADAIRFAEDRMHHAYDADAVHRFWRALFQVDRVFKRFRAEFAGKASPVHFFWGSFDLAVTRFSGRTAPDLPGGMPNMPLWVAQEAYSHEVSSAGFWPGNEDYPEAIFYSYAYPAPEQFSAASVEPAQASWSAQLGEFVLPYEAVRTASNPEDALLAFLHSTFDAAAGLADWDLDAYRRRHFPA